MPAGKRFQALGAVDFGFAKCYCKLNREPMAAWKKK
jgi:hypothetical protein